MCSHGHASSPQLSKHHIACSNVLVNKLAASSLKTPRCIQDWDIDSGRQGKGIGSTWRTSPELEKSTIDSCET